MERERDGRRDGQRETDRGRAGQTERDRDGGEGGIDIDIDG